MPQKAHMLQACLPAAGTVDRWLDHEGTNIINELILRA